MNQDDLMTVLAVGIGATFVCLIPVGRRVRSELKIVLGLSLVALAVALVMVLLLR